MGRKTFVLSSFYFIFEFCFLVWCLLSHEVKKKKLSKGNDLPILEEFPLNQPQKIFAGSKVKLHKIAKK